MDLLKVACRIVITWVVIRVMLFGKSSIGLSDLAGRGSSRNAERAICLQAIHVLRLPALATGQRLEKSICGICRRFRRDGPASDGPPRSDLPQVMVPFVI